MGSKKTAAWVILAFLLGLAAGVSASIGLDAYLDFMRRSKPPAAVTRMAELAVAADAYLEAHPGVPRCGPHPAKLPSWDQPIPWPAPPACLETLGFAPRGHVGASYSIAPLPGKGYLITASMLAQNGRVLTLVMTRGGPIVSITTTPPAVWQVLSKEELGRLSRE